jgi:hypothetical protein
VEVSEEFYRIGGFDPAEGAPTWGQYFERGHPEDRLKWTGITERAIVAGPALRAAGTDPVQALREQ